MIKRILLNRWFLTILAVKILFSFIFANHILAQGFAPFLNYFVKSGLQNPYNHYLELGLFKAFPYSTVMLWILAIPRAVFDFIFPNGLDINALSLFVTRIPVLIADIVIYSFLCSWLTTKENKVILFYWASPILFYINYFHGQLDAIPTALLFISLGFFFMQKDLLSYMILGLGIAAKSHLLAVFPFYFIYSYVKKTPVLHLTKYVISTVLITVILILPYFFSPGYQQLVLKAEEQGWIFLLNLQYNNGGLALLLAPIAYLLLLFRFASYKKVTNDFFIMMLGLMFSVLIIFVSPMPGWFYWSIPFLAYFYIKNKEAPTLNFWLLNIFFLAYFLFNKQSDIFAAFQSISPKIASLPTPYAYFQNIGVNSDLITNILFTALEASLIMNVIWCYKVGIRDNFTYKIKVKPLLIGISGDSGTGKTTLADDLAKLFDKQKVLCISGDDAHKWPRGHQNWTVFTHLNPKSNLLHKELQTAVALKAGHPIERIQYDHKTGTFTNPVRMEPNQIILFEGLHPYYIKSMRPLFDVKIFMEPAENLRRHWKLSRDVEERNHSAEKVIEEMTKRSEDAKKFIQPQKNLADIIISYEPLKSIDKLGSRHEKVNLRLRILVDNSIDIEPFFNAFAEHKQQLAMEYLYENLDKISVVCSGKISAQQLETIAYQLIPNLREITQTTPVWNDGLSGIAQLFILYYLSEMSRFKESTDVPTIY